MDLNYQSKKSMRNINKLSSLLDLVYFNTISLIKIVFYTFLLFVNSKEEYDSSDDVFTYITAADEQYFEPCFRLIKNLIKLDKLSEIVVIDLGLSKLTLNKFKNFSNVTIEKFNFNKYPKFVSLKELPDNKLGNYSWKAIAIEQILQSRKTNIIWMDSACIFNYKLNKIKKIILLNGVFFVRATGKIRDWTHSQTIKITEGQNLLNKNCVMSGIVGIKYKNLFARNLISEWSKLSLNEECIAPKGSNRLNHRQDQSILQILVYKFNFGKYVLSHEHFDIKINQVFDRVFIEDLNKNHYLFELRNKIFEFHPTFFTNSFERANWYIIFNQKIINKKNLNHTKNKYVMYIQLNKENKYIKINLCINNQDLHTEQALLDEISFDYLLALFSKFSIKKDF